MGTLRERQSRFAFNVALLICFAYEQGYEITFGDAYAKTGHKIRSKHYSRLAIDLNLFRDGKFLEETKDHEPLGEFWESLDEECIWGGMWGDGNHYQYGHG